MLCHIVWHYLQTSQFVFFKNSFNDLEISSQFSFLVLFLVSLLIFSSISTPSFDFKILFEDLILLINYLFIYLFLENDLMIVEREKLKILFLENSFLTGLMCHVGSQVIRLIKFTCPYEYLLICFFPYL